MRRAIVFVHGLVGHATRSWGSFPALLRADPLIGPTVTIELYAFPSRWIELPGLGRSPRLQELAAGLRTFVDHRLGGADDMTLVCHSLGGLVARRMIVDQIKLRRDHGIRRLFLYGVPNTGADLARVASVVSPFQRQLRQLCRNSDVIRGLNDDWELLRAAETVQTTYVVGGRDEIVDVEAARGAWRRGDVETIVDATHCSLVKPRAPTDLAFLVLRQRLLADRQRMNVPCRSSLIA